VDTRIIDSCTDIGMGTGQIFIHWVGCGRIITCILPTCRHP